MVYDIITNYKIILFILTNILILFIIKFTHIINLIRLIRGKNSTMILKSSEYTMKNV